MTARHLLYEQTAKTIFSSACAVGSKIDLIFELNPKVSSRLTLGGDCSGQCVSCGSTQNVGLTVSKSDPRTHCWISLDSPSFHLGKFGVARVLIMFY